MNKWRMVYGFALLAILAVLATVFALGKVEQQSSYGLMPIVTSLATLAGGFTQWAFQDDRSDRSEVNHERRDG